MVSVSPMLGVELIRIGLLAEVGALAVSVSDPIVTVAPPTALFPETVPTALALAVVPSVVVDVVQAGVAVPLVEPASPHPPAVHFWMFPFVSTISAFEAKLVEGVHGPIVGAALVILKVMTQPPAVVALAPHELLGTDAKSQSTAVPLVL